MLPFDLTKALAGAEVVYRNGEVPLEWHYFEKSQAVYPIITISENGTEMKHTPRGIRDLHQHSPFDLFLKEPEMFVNKSEGICMTSIVYYSRKEAEKDCQPPCKTYRLVEVTDK